MRLEHITTELCPVCGSGPATESVEVGTDRSIRVHENGQRWEKRHFACGNTVAWLPGYSKELQLHTCGLDPTKVAHREKRKKAKVILAEAIRSLDLPWIDRNEISECLHDWLSWWSTTDAARSGLSDDLPLIVEEESS